MIRASLVGDARRCLPAGYNFRVPTRLLTAGLLVAVLTPCAMGRIVPRYAQIETPDLVARTADVVINLTNVESHGAFLSADGRSIFVIKETPTANIWALIVYFWPLWATLVLAGIEFLILRKLVREMRRRSKVGEPYCRKCGYCLVACASAQCPECGVSLESSPPRRSRSRTNHLYRTAAWTAMLVLLSLMLWGVDLPRSGAVSRWFDWPSRDLHAWLDERDLSREMKFAIGGFAIELVEFETQGGTEVGRTELDRWYPADLEEWLRWRLIHSIGGRNLTCPRNGTLLRWVVAPNAYVYDEETRTVIEKVNVESDWSRLNTLDAKYGFEPYHRDGHVTEQVEIEGVKIDICPKCLSAWRGDGDSHGRYAGDIVFKRVRSESDGWYPNVLLGDRRRGLWFARLDPGLTFFDAAASRDGDCVMICDDQYPNKILLFDLRPELSRLPDE